MSDNTQAEFTVTWDKEQIDTSKAGVYTYYGEVDGYSKKVKLIITVVPVTISLNKKVITLNSGETETLAATIVPSDINLNDLKWYSSSNSIAIVDNNGKITALNSGSAIITVRTSNGLIKDTCTVNVTNMDAIKFPDEAFEKAIRRSIRKLSGDILKSDLEKITVLSAESFNITNISGVENLINLEKLYLADNKISDINTLSGLVKLDTLNIDNNQISDISSIKNLKRLQQLFFDQNIINNISVLSNLTKLRLLYIRNNSINEADILSLKKVLPKCIIFYK